MKPHSIIRPVLLSSLILTVVGCGSSDGTPIVPPSTGGQTASGNGGASTVGGNVSTQSNTGGAPMSSATGGSSNSNTTGGSNNGNQGGSSTTTGGSNTTSVGGSSTSTGGSNTTTTGGKAAGGGNSTTGGSNATVGGATTGGKAAGGSNSTTGGSSTTATGGSSTTPTGGKAAGGSSTATGGGTATATGGASTATGGANSGTGVSQSSTCPNITWPTSNGTKNVGSGMTVPANGVYDGGMAVHEGSLEDCSTGDQDSTDPLIEVANGGTVKNVIMGKNVGDGIHCLGSCTIENVWFPYVCDDAISALGSGTVSIKNCGFKNARDKTIQHNGSATINIDTVYVETAGKLYRSCGDGCSGGARTANLSNIVAIGVDQVAGASTADTVTLKNICTHRTAAICTLYQPGSESKATSAGVNSTNDGPGSACKFTGADTHALLSRVTGVSFSTDAVCGGPNGYKSGDTATACVSGYDKCLKMCLPGGYGFKELSCTNGKYAETTGCAMPTDSTAATNLAGTRVGGASSTVTKNNNCTTEWAIGVDSSNSANYCVCVKKPGYYSFTNWLAWDCQAKWW